MPIDGFPVTVQNPRLESAVLLWVVSDLVSRDSVTIKNSGGAADLVLDVGTVLGQISVGSSGSYAANAGNTGNFTCGAVTIGQGAATGTYPIEFIAATVFNVYNPSGDLVGEGHTGVAFSAGGLGFTITAGGTAAVAGDGATITVAANADAGLYVPIDFSAADGSQNPAAVLVQRAFIPAGTNDDGNIVNFMAAVREGGLIWPAGATASQIAAAEAQMKTDLRIFTKASV